ncbi:nitrate ABC transporter ATP-binding protein [Opitutaceae bacterium TAV5]|nr:nitrate ABC transporter ATP-binding protein [Opitutaceae bacterium TAV5]
MPSVKKSGSRPRAASAAAAGFPARPASLPTASPPSPASSRPLRLGFIALSDAAPLIVAHEYGFFRRQGLAVELSREVGWATIRDKVIYGELDAAHALGAMVVSTALGLEGPARPCLTACLLSSEGNAITLSESLWQRGVRDVASLRDEIVRNRHERPLVLGVVYRFSTHHLLLCEWLRSGGIDPGRDVRIVVVPPAQLFRNLAAGTIDGYCVGEPWTSLAVREAVGWCAARSRDISPEHPEKVLMAGGEFAATRGDEHLALVAAVSEAAELCDRPDFRPELARLLGRREYLNLAERVLAAGLAGPFSYGHNRLAADTAQRTVAFTPSRPEPGQADWLVESMRRHGLIPAGFVLPRHFSRTLFRADLFAQALQRRSLSAAGSA